MDKERLLKQVRKQSQILIKGLRPSALLGRFVGPRVLINSVPKAGTNLLQEIVLRLPFMRGKISRTLHLSHGSDAMIRKLTSLRKGQCMTGHIIYDEAVDIAIQASGIKHVMIIRDFRDVVYSNIQYLATGHISHPHNKLFAQMSSLDEKISACLLGSEVLDIRPWADLMKDYRGWQNSKEILIVRFENLMNPDSKISEAEIYKVAVYLNPNISILDTATMKMELGEIRQRMINPKGLTFSAPGIDKWKGNFNQNQISRLNEALREDLIYWGIRFNGY